MSTTQTPDPVQHYRRLADEAKTAAPVVCTNPLHEHFTTIGPDGSTLDEAVPAICTYDQLPMHWTELGQWRHDDPDAPRCRIYYSDADGSPCSRPPELTDELAKTLAAVVDNTLEYPDDDDNAPAANALVDHERRRAKQQKTEQDATLSVLASLGLIHATHDGRWFAELAGREALAAREAAKEAARVQAVRASYAAVVAELRSVADAIDTVTVDDLSDLRVEIRISTAYRRHEDDAEKVRTVDAFAVALLDGSAPKTERLGSSDTWQRKAEGRRGPIKVEVAAFVDDPTAREREAAEQARVAELERLRAEVAELRAATVETLASAGAPVNSITFVDDDEDA